MNDLLTWLDENSQKLSAATSAAMTLVWIAYLQIALMTYVRQRRSRLVID